VIGRAQAVDLTALVKDALATSGFLLLPAVLDPEVVAAVRDELDVALATEEDRYGVDELIAIGNRGYVADVLAMGPATRALLGADVVHDAVTAALGDDARLSIAQGISLAPGEGRGQWPRCWHADLFGPRVAMPDPGFCFAVNCMVVLDDMEAVNGATAIAPGSQAFIPADADADAIEGLAMDVAAPAGSLLLIDGGLWHAAGHNASEHPRRVMKLLFVRGWIRPQLDYAALLVQTPYEDLSPRTVALLSGGGGVPAPEGVG
jgi:ectoine hydroxylase-related dioxygenase (phytanoyl-CoA dioxygenase family)